MREIEIIAAPSNLGLRPLRPGHTPGAWRAPEALRDAGLHTRLNPRLVHSLPRPVYELDAQPGTRIRNGHTIRRFSENLANTVQGVLANGNVPVVIGGDCSVLLGCLLGARRTGRCGLVHVDGHSDFFHPGNYNVTARLGSAAGMDLALATGRGESLLTQWKGVAGALVDDGDVVQIGERDELDSGYAYADIQQTKIRQVPVRHLKKIGILQCCEEVSARFSSRGLTRIWLHVDVDVLDQSVMPAVDSPGSPGLNFDELSALIKGLCQRLPVLGVDVTIYDPDLDPSGIHAKNLVSCLVGGLTDLANGRAMRNDDAISDRDRGDYDQR
ncbi:arginase family protein [Meiothermus granaticius]|uniref:Arginase n=1 Tax=Meiothermus granaticius NBRC 107808 TaxID=1227551 RepID=A0A399F5Q3_9DEIN|nr:arginase family protein [Meiothermus granaticius]RIH91075.1 Arginase [Meiothermus granaticius NBRC 107808]GEM87957.1 arginase [Meiothermus granaticius NBRC 107808]